MNARSEQAEMKMCFSKRRYDRRGVRSVLNCFSRVRGRHGRPEGLRAYACPLCCGWHVTKSRAYKPAREPDLLASL